jgi:hypothetical protein
MRAYRMEIDVATARRYRQAKYYSQNLFNISSRKRSVNRTEAKFRTRVPGHHEAPITTQSSDAGFRNHRTNDDRRADGPPR